MFSLFFPIYKTVCEDDNNNNNLTVRYRLMDRVLLCFILYDNFCIYIIIHNIYIYYTYRTAILYNAYYRVRVFGAHNREPCNGALFSFFFSFRAMRNAVYLQC